MNARNDMTDTAALVTGASQGLGAALSRVLAAAGAKVVLVARGTEALARVTSEIVAAGGTAYALPGDVSDKRAVHKIVGAAAALVGPIDLVVHNASTLGPVPLRPLAETDCEDVEAALTTNVLGPMRLTKALLGHMLLTRRGLVVNITSDASVNPYPTWGAYGASKAALDHMTAIWGAELEGTDVRILAVDPGEMRTRMHAAALPDADPASLQDPHDVAARLLTLIRTAHTLPNGARVTAASFPPSSTLAADGAPALAAAEAR